MSARVKRGALIGKICMTAGLLCVCAAVGLILYNLADEKRAADLLASNTPKLTERIEQNRENEQNRIRDIQENDPTASVVPDYVLAPEYGMPTETVDGLDYVGIVTIQKYGTELPVLAEWSYPNLKVAPCRYSGSVYTNDLVLCGHNYTVHFGPIKNLTQGDKILFTDVLGNKFSYTVAEVETLQPSALRQIGSAGYDLTLFSCTIGGQYRVTVRCTLDQ